MCYQVLYCFYKLSLRVYGGSRISESQLKCFLTFQWGEEESGPKGSLDLVRSHFTSGPDIVLFHFNIKVPSLNDGKTVGRLNWLRFFVFVILILVILRSLFLNFNGWKGTHHTVWEWQKLKYFESKGCRDSEMSNLRTKVWCMKFRLKRNRPGVSECTSNTINK